MVLWNQEFFFMEAIVKYQNRVFFKMAFTKILDTVFIAQILKSRQRDGLSQKKECLSLISIVICQMRH